MSSWNGTNYSSLWHLWSWISAAHSRSSFPGVSTASLFVPVLGRLACRSVLGKRRVTGLGCPVGGTQNNPCQRLPECARFDDQRIPDLNEEFSAGVYVALSSLNYDLSHIL